ncbi:DNA polymerase [Bienertia sinuspersici]
MLFRFRDSLNLLLSSLNSLAKNLCPELGNKGSLDHNSINLWNLAEKREEVIEYMKQDIILLGGVMQKAQKLCWDVYKVDIEKWMTVASLALGIYQIKYFNDRNPMPGGKPVRHSNLSGMDLDSMCGFIEAYVECPDSMGRPFLPYRGKDNILLFPGRTLMTRIRSRSMV